jgi:hypothetical protein
MSNKKKNIPRSLPRIFVLCLLYFVFFVHASAADATLYISPITGTYTIGAEVPLRVMVSSAGDPVNAIEGKLTYDPKEIEVVSAVKDGSVLTSWTIPPTYDNDAGTLSFGGLLATSTVLDRGLAVSFIIKAKRSGDVRIHFATGAAVHAADGTGGNLLSTLNGGIYAIVPKEGILASTSLSEVSLEDVSTSSEMSLLATSSDGVSGEVLGAATGTIITSTTHPDQTLWYALGTSTINWEIPEGLVRVRLALDKKPDGEGIVSYDAPKHEKVLTNLEDGIWYVHATREFSDGHSDTNTYQFRIDRTPPANVTVTEKPRESNTNPNAIFLLTATDTTSGIDHYMITLDDETSVSWSDDGTHEYHTKALKIGAHQLTLSAVDKAGNKSDAHTNFSIEYLEAPTLTIDTKQFTEGDHLSFSLVSVPNAVMSLTLSGGGQTTNEEFTLDANGRGTFLSQLSLLPGTYEVWGVSRNAQGALSRESTHVNVDVRPSFMGIVKRHPLIPVAVIVLFVFMFFMRMFLKKIRSGESFFAVDEGEDDEVDEEDEEIHTPPATRPLNSGAVVLSAIKPKQRDRSNSVTITR